VYVTYGKNGICYELTKLAGKKWKNDVLKRKKMLGFVPGSHMT